MAITTAAHRIYHGSGMDMSHVPEAYWELIEKYRGELINQAQAILGSREDAEDVVQETFCDALRDYQKLSGAGSIGAWLRSINRCNALNRHRDKRRLSGRMGPGQQVEPEQMFTTGGFNVIELRDSVTKALNALPPTLKTVVVMRYWEHLSYKEIAARLGIPIGNVSGMLWDASVRLYSKLNVQLGALPASKKGAKLTRIPGDNESTKPVTGIQP